MQNLEHIFVKLSLYLNKLPIQKFYPDIYSGVIKNFSHSFNKAPLFFTETSGVVAIEFALLVPILLGLALAIVEFANYFIIEFAAQRAVSSAAGYIQTVYPNSTMTDAQKINFDLHNMAGNFGSGIINPVFLQDGNKFCGQAFATDTQANKFGGCPTNQNFKVGRYDADPSGVFVNNKTNYYASIVLTIPYSTITGVESLAGFKMPKIISARTIINISAALPNMPSASCTANQYLTYSADKNSLICNDLPQSTGSNSSFPDSAAIPEDCNTNGKVLKFYGGEFHCEHVGSNPKTLDCDDKEVNGLKWDGSKYQCIKTEDNEQDDDNCNYYADNDNSVERFVKYDNQNKSYKCHCKKKAS